jgi:hypothetical protein
MRTQANGRLFKEQSRLLTNNLARQQDSYTSGPMEAVKKTKLHSMPSEVRLLFSYPDSLYRQSVCLPPTEKKE